MEQNTDSKIPAYLKEYWKNESLQLSNLEKLGAASLSFGYANYIRAAQLDILDILKMNNTGLKPSSITVFGQRFVLLGYIILFYVSSKRLNQRSLIISEARESIDLTPFKDVQLSYLISVYANALRLNAFIEIDNSAPSGELIQ